MTTTTSVRVYRSRRRSGRPRPSTPFIGSRADALIAKIRRAVGSQTSRRLVSLYGKSIRSYLLLPTLGRWWQNPFSKVAPNPDQNQAIVRHRKSCRCTDAKIRRAFHSRTSSSAAKQVDKIETVYACSQVVLLLITILSVKIRRVLK